MQLWQRVPVEADARFDLPAHLGSGDALVAVLVYSLQIAGAVVTATRLGLDVVHLGGSGQPATMSSAFAPFALAQAIVPSQDHQPQL